MGEAPRVTIRAVESADLDRIVRMWPRLSNRTIYRRFHTPVHQFPAASVNRLVQADHEHYDALVAVLDDEVVGVSRYERLVDDPQTAEFAVVVQDDCQGMGVGRRLLDEIIVLARARGVTRLIGFVVADNTPMLRLLRRHLPDGERHLAEGIYEVVIPLLPDRDPESTPAPGHTPHAEAEVRPGPPGPAATIHPDRT